MIILPQLPSTMPFFLAILIFFQLIPIYSYVPHSYSLFLYASVSVSVWLSVSVCVFVCMCLLVSLPPSLLPSSFLFFPPRHWTQGYGCQTQWSSLLHPWLLSLTEPYLLWLTSRALPQRSLQNTVVNLLCWCFCLGREKWTQLFSHLKIFPGYLLFWY